jgi:large subunit ribosomal protein L24
MKLKKGDQVIITAGKDRGKKGKIEKIFYKNKTVFLPGLNVYKRHLKKRDEKHPGGIIDFSRPLPIANVSLICHKCGKPTRVGFKIEAKEKLRVCRKCDSTL